MATPTTQPTADTAATPVASETTWQKAKRLAHEATAKVEDSKVGQWTGEAKDTVVHEAGNLKDDAVSAGGRIKNEAGKAKDAVVNKADDLKEKAEQDYQISKDGIKHLVDKVSEKLGYVPKPAPNPAHPTTAPTTAPSTPDVKTSEQLRPGEPEHGFF